MANMYCSKRDRDCFTNQPLLTVISQWFHENHDIDFDFNPLAVIYFGFLSLIAWVLIKIFFRIIKSMLKPLLFIVGILIIMYTKQFSHNEDAGDFVFNTLENTILLVSKILETVNRIIFGEQVAL